ncbi:MAG: hypothetical protein BV456_11120 [Thermoplasmata archaeon M8B2D]|nr:MAG: hypothetical protein BV456_11120 [Thermoplasmata archaeon M8B2D]
MKDPYIKKILTAVLLACLVIAVFLILRPVLIAIIVALILAFIFSPVYKWIYKVTGWRNISAFIILLFLLLLILLPIWFLTPILLKQSFSIFQYTQQIDYVKPLKSLFPRFFTSDEFSSEVGSILSSFTSKVANSFVNSLSNFILNFPTIALQLLVVLFTFFYVLRDEKQFVDYVKGILPFSKEVEKKLFDYSRGITASVIYGQVVIGIIQGIIAGIGFFIFGVSNALFLALLAILAGIFPIIGTAVIWLPVAIFLFIAGNVTQGWGVIVFGLISSTVDNFLRPIIVARRTNIHSGILLISMIGGVFFFGVLGFILGPLIISYLIILLEIYRGSSLPSSILNQEPAKD